MGWLKFAIFIVFSSVLLLFTLRRPHSHRGYRFIAFECVLALIFIQADAWFANPFRPVQIISWLVLAGSLALAIHGFRLLKVRGAPEGDIENTTILVTAGAYRFIRHPLYASLLLFGVGATIKHLSPWPSFILLVLFLAAYATARAEERANLDHFGEPYQAYMVRTRMFIPFLW